MMKNKFIRFLKDNHAFDEFKKEMRPYRFGALNRQFKDGSESFVLQDGCIFYWKDSVTEVNWMKLDGLWRELLKKGNIMKTKLLYIDTETTGLYPNKHGLTQVAAIVVIDGEEKERIDLPIDPNSYLTFVPQIDDVALEIQGRTREELELHKGSYEQFMEFTTTINEHLKEDEKFQIVGYNTSFDIGFIKAWFKDSRTEKFSDYFTYKDVDVFALVKHLRLLGFLHGCENDKLATVCEHYGIEIDAHDAMNDIVATRELYQYLVDQYITSNSKI